MLGVASIVSSLLKAVLEMDHVSTETHDDTTVYIFKTTGIHPSTVELKAKILSMLDLPFDIPYDVEIEEVKRGPVMKEYLIKIYVKKRGLGRLRNIFKKKYRVFGRGRIRERLAGGTE